MTSGGAPPITKKVATYRNSEIGSRHPVLDGYPALAHTNWHAWAGQSAPQELVRTFMVDVNVTSLTVEAYLQTWLVDKHALKPQTMALYQDFTKRYLVPDLGQIRLLELRAHHLDRMCAAIALGRRARPLSPSTIRRVHAVLRSALNTAVKPRLMPYNPANHIELAPESPKRPRPWTAEQCQTIFGVDQRFGVKLLPSGRPPSL